MDKEKQGKGKKDAKKKVLPGFEPGLFGYFAERILLPDPAPSSKPNVITTTL